jgi:hypothetical protein
MKPWTPELDAVDDKRRAEVVAALEASSGNITHAAERLQLARSYLNRLLRRYSLVERAAELRLASGRSGKVKFGTQAGRVTGRPRSPR